MNETSQLKAEVHLPILFITPCNVAHTSGSPFPHAFEDPWEMHNVNVHILELHHMKWSISYFKTGCQIRPHLDDRQEIYAPYQGQAYTTI